MTQLKQLIKSITLLKAIMLCIVISIPLIGYSFYNLYVSIEVLTNEADAVIEEIITEQNELSTDIQELQEEVIDLKEEIEAQQELEEEILETDPVIEAQQELEEEILETDPVIEETNESESETTEVEASTSAVNANYLGVYELTAYCACEQCCGKTDGITASGTTATAGRTVGCNSLAFGTEIVINGHTYIVEDTGGMSSNVIDIFFDSHEEALAFGRQTAEVYLAE